MSKTVPLYLRLPAELKEDVDRFAAAADSSLSAAVSRLVVSGLRSHGDELAEARERIALLEAEVATLTADRAEVQRELAALNDEMAQHRHVIETVFQRLRLPVGHCPECGRTVSGADVFVRGACDAGHNLQGAIVNSDEKTGLNRGELLAALAVVGVALGIAAMAAKAS